jgi:hypothetical protein
MQTRTSLILLQIFSLLGFGFISGARGEIEDRITKSFDVNPGGKLTINSARGTIEVKTTRANVVNVEVIRKARTSSEKEARELFENFEISFRHNGNDVIIETEMLKERFSFWDFGSNDLRVQFLISVPEKYNVDLNTAGGSISVSDLDGEVLAHTSGGSLNFGKITGPVTGKTSGGSINLDGCAGDIDVHTSGGSIVVGEVKGEVLARTSGGSIQIAQAQASVDAKTSGGSINIEEVLGAVNASTSGGSVTARISRQPRENCSLKTSGGSVNVYLAEGIGVNLDAQTSGGRVVNDFPIEVQGVISKTSLEAKVNGGGPDLILRTSGGNINLKRL